VRTLPSPDFHPKRPSYGKPHLSAALVSILATSNLCWRAPLNRLPLSLNGAASPVPFRDQHPEVAASITQTASPSSTQARVWCCFTTIPPITGADR